MAVARHIPVAGSPSMVISTPSQPFVYALTPTNGTVHEIALAHLNISRQFASFSVARALGLAPDGRSLYLLTQSPKSLIRVGTESLRAEWKLALPEDPVDLAIAPDGNTAAVSGTSSLWLVDLEQRKLRPLVNRDGRPPDSATAGGPEYGAVQFLSNSRTLIAADRERRRLSFYDVASAQLITHLPLAVRPDYLCFNADGGQLFVTGEGMDAVVVVYPYHTPQVAETVLAGHQPGPMAASQQFLFVANPASGDVSILQINARKMIAVVSVGTDPGFITVTPDDQYALVLNRKSGDVSVLRVGTITRNRDRRASLLTVIPVGSRPVSAVVRAV
jgi:DNA-binding beta-propeller fold protein YncE